MTDLANVELIQFWNKYLVTDANLLNERIHLIRRPSNIYKHILVIFFIYPLTKSPKFIKNAHFVISISV